MTSIYHRKIHALECLETPFVRYVLTLNLRPDSIYLDGSTSQSCSHLAAALNSSWRSFASFLCIRYCRLQIAVECYVSGIRENHLD